MASELKVQCPNCNSILMLAGEELRAGVQCRFCGEELRPTHTDPTCNFCRGQGFAMVGDVAWICQLGEEI